VLVQPGAVEQVLVNLIANAVEVAPAGSVVVLRSQRARDSVEIHVIDQGPGMAPQVDVRLSGRTRCTRGAEPRW
jgi:signal transduction histidine kinase